MTRAAGFMPNSGYMESTNSIIFIENFDKSRFFMYDSITGLKKNYVYINLRRNRNYFIDNDAQNIYA